MSTTPTIVVCLIRPLDLAGRLGGGLRRFIEVGRRIYGKGVTYLIIESEPFLASFRFFPGIDEIKTHHKILSVHTPWETIGTRRVVGPITFWLKLAALMLAEIKAIKSTRTSLVMIPGETLSEVIVGWASCIATRRRGLIVIQSDPFLPIGQYEVKDIGSFYAAYRTMYNPITSFIEALIAQLQIKAFNRMALLVVSCSLSRLLERRGIRGRMRVCVENGIDMEMIKRTSPSEFRSDAVYVGRIDALKVTCLLRAWPRLTRQRQAFKLALVGPVQEKMRPMVEAATNAPESAINVLGPLTAAEVIGVLRSSRILLQPSAFESFSLVVAEALACGVPVIAYDSIGIREFFATPAVSLVPSGDIEALVERAKELLEKESERLRLGRIGLEYVARFNWNKVVEREAEIILQLVRSEPD